MKIGILCACEEELAPFLPELEGCTVTTRGKWQVYGGLFRGVETAAVVSGMCKVNAAAAAQLLITGFGADAVINSGTAGAMRGDLEVFDTVISAETLHHDVDPSVLTDHMPRYDSAVFPADARLLALSREAALRAPGVRQVFWGRMATGERFIDTEGRQAINERFAPLCVDMETAAIAQVCCAFGVPYLSVRTITDTPSERGSDNFLKNLPEAAAISKDVTAAVFELLRESGK